MTGRYKAYPTYKSSTFEWLGDIPKHWDVVYSKWLFSERKVKAQPTDEMLTASQKYGVIPQKMFMELEQQKVVQVQKGHDILKQVKKNDFVISMRSFQGGIEFCDYDGAVSSAYVPLESRNNGYSTYFKYLFKSKPYIQALQATTNLVRDGQALRFTNFTQVRLPLPTESEAQCIGTFLHHETAKIDTLITKQEKLIELLKEKRQSVISHAVTKGLNPDAPMKDSGVEWLGDVPEHWDVIFIKHLSRVKRGASPRPIDDPKYFDDNGEYAWTRITDVSSAGMYLNSTTQRLSTLGSSLSVRLNANELFLSIAGTVGKPCITVSKACIHDGFVYFPELKINNKFLYYIFDAGQAYLGLGKMGTQLNLNTDTVGGIKVGLPPKDEIEQIVTHIENQSRKYSELIDRAVDSIELMKERKTALISAAVTGKIDVRDWQEPTYQESA
ncbi:TPA: restriction endonuclease subunit S [Vibrio parahaemolyticus]|nr:restriction endonuclease subunit S [Vibrio parahaemolyticus]